MRLRSFLMGGIIGASAVWLTTNRQHPLMNIAKTMVKGTFSSGKSASQPKSTSSYINHTDEKSRKENESIIRSFIEQDPKLKKEFSEITKQTYTGNNEQGISAVEQLQ